MEAIYKIEEWKAIGNPEKPLVLKNMNLEVLPELPSNLQILDCSNNKLVCLKNLPSSLRDLNCSGNNLNLHKMTKLEVDDYFKSVLPPDISRVVY